MFHQILVNGSDPEARDVAGCKLPTLVYLAREKRPEHFHNFKAGAMNALVTRLLDTLLGLNERIKSIRHIVIKPAR